MKAAVLKSPNQLVYQGVDDPQLDPGDMLLRVKAATICGTDIRIYRGRKTSGIRYPSILGHEFVGEIVDTGGNAGFACGETVGVCPAIACGRCDHCKRGYENICRNLIAIGYEIDGAFAEYIRIPALAVKSGNIFKIPGHVGPEKAALVEPLACVLNGQQKLGPMIGDTVVVLGAGPIGLLHVKLARLSGAHRIIVSEPNAARRAATLRAGADVALDPQSDDLNAIVKDATNGLGADKVIVAIGVTRLADDAVALVRHRGAISLFAGFSVAETAQMDVNAIHYKELIMTGSFGLNRLQYETSLNLIASERIEVGSMLTHRFGLEEIGAALQTAEDGTAVKVAIVAN